MIGGDGQRAVKRQETVVETYCMREEYILKNDVGVRGFKTQIGLYHVVLYTNHMWNPEQTQT